jgi:hypothetical protein
MSVDQPKSDVISDVFFFAGDEILAVNGEALQGMSHAEAIAAFKRIRSGPVALRLARRQLLRYTLSLLSFDTPYSSEFT